MEFVREIPALLTSVGGFVIALAVAFLVKKLGTFIEKIQP
jgi:hypothetical protein